MPLSCLLRRGAVSRVPAIALALALSSCTPQACSEDNSDIEREVKVLTQRDGRDVKLAKARLIRRGKGALVLLETGLYTATPEGRIRIIEVLSAIGGEASDVLRHLSARDPSPLVRQRAQLALDHEPK